jgi:carboxyl-terminal processing protease
VESFCNNFKIDNRTISELTDFAETHYNLSKDSAAVEKTKDRLKIFLKAYIGRNIYENGAYYFLIKDTDKLISNSLLIINDKSTFKKMKVKYK